MKKILFALFLTALAPEIYNCAAVTDSNQVANGSAIPFAGSCSVVISGFYSCANYNGSIYTSSTLSTNCTNSGGTYSASGCPATSPSGGACVGKCITNPGTTNEYHAIYYLPFPYSAISCTGGTLTTACP